MLLELPGDSQSERAETARMMQRWEYYLYELFSGNFLALIFCFERLKDDRGVSFCIAVYESMGFFWGAAVP